MSRQTSNTASGSQAKGRASGAVIEPEAPDLEQSVEDRKAEQKARLKGLDREILVELYYQMILVRRFEEKSAESYSIGKIGGFCHLYIGQEAVAVGAISLPCARMITCSPVIVNTDTPLPRAFRADERMAELYGKAGGCS